jgi:hypothetical protein
MQARRSGQFRAVNQFAGISGRNGISSRQETPAGKKRDRAAKGELALSIRWRGPCSEFRHAESSTLLAARFFGAGRCNYACRISRTNQTMTYTGFLFVIHSG